MTENQTIKQRHWPTELSEISVDLLEYNPDNPRLPESLRGASQAEIEEFIGTGEVVENIIGSIVVNGLLPNMPILVAPLGNTGKFRVMDGARRLVSVKSFTNPKVQKWLLPKAREAIDSTDYRPTKMIAYVADSIETAFEILGTIHIENPIPWSGLPRSIYIAELFDQTEGTADERLTEVSRRIGARFETVLRHINLVALHQHAVSKGFHGTGSPDRSFRMYRLWNALASHSIKEFIGCRTSNGNYVCFLTNPEHIKSKAVEELFDWLYAEDERGRRAVLNSSKEGERKLATVVQYPKALEYLRETRDLDRAYARTPESSESFRNYIREAIWSLSRAEEYARGMTYETEDGGQLLTDVEMAVFRVGQQVVMSKHAVLQTEDEYYASRPNEDTQESY